MWNQKQQIASCTLSPCSETIAIAALSLHYMQSVGQLGLVTGSWTNHKLSPPPPLYALTIATRGLMHWSCMTAIWRSCVSFHAGVLVFASVREGTSAGKLTMKQLCMHHSNTCYRLSMRLLWALRSSQADKLLFPQEWLTTSAVWFMQIQQLDLDCNGNQEVISTNRKNPPVTYDSPLRSGDY